MLEGLWPSLVPRAGHITGSFGCPCSLSVGNCTYSCAYLTSFLPEVWSVCLLVLWGFLSHHWFGTHPGSGALWKLWNAQVQLVLLSHLWARTHGLRLPSERDLFGLVIICICDVLDCVFWETLMCFPSSAARFQHSLTQELVADWQYYDDRTKYLAVRQDNTILWDSSIVGGHKVVTNFTWSLRKHYFLPNFYLC